MIFVTPHHWEDNNMITDIWVVKKVYPWHFVRVNDIHPPVSQNWLEMPKGHERTTITEMAIY